MKLGPLILAQALAVSSFADEFQASKESALWAKLEARLEAIDRGLDGVLGISVKDLKSGRVLEIRQNEVFPTASTIKIAILYELYRRSEEGRIDLAEVTQPPLPRAGGDGILQLLGDRVSLSWRDLAVLMMSHSDNEATNLLIDRVGQGAINARLGSLGLRQTAVRRRMMDATAARRGDENLSTPGELRQLMEVVWSGQGLSSERIRDIRALLALPKGSPFRAPLPAGLVVADKPGTLDGVRAAVALVDLPGRPYAAAVMTGYLRKGADGERAISEISSALFETFDRLARSSEHGRGLR